MARLGAGVLVAAALLSSSAAWARGGPDLVVASLTDPPLTVVAGSPVSVTEAVRNAGPARARASAVSYSLSEDKRASKGDVRIAARRAVGALARAKQSKRRVSLRVPVATRAGLYHLIACADAAGKVRERSERNNCRASKGRVAVRPQPRPLTVTPVLDSARAASGTIGAPGGVMTATAANGATLALQVPAGALLSDVSITMTPLSAITGLPFPRGLVAAVQLAPEGLRFLAPATLTVTPAAPVAAGGHAAFSYRGNGESFHLVRSSATGGAISLSLSHFSGAGVAQASGSEAASAAAANPPADAADQAEQQAAVPGDTNALDGAVVNMYAIIFGLAQDRASLDQALMFYNVWYPIALGSQAGVAMWPILHGQLTELMLRHITEARARCASGGSLDEAGWMLRIAELSRRLLIPAPNVVQVAADAVTSCVRFELDVSADIANNLELDRGSIQGKVTGLEITAVNGLTPDHLAGSKTIEVLGYRIDDFDCWVHTWNPQPARPFGVVSMRLSGLNGFFQNAPEPVQVESVQVDFGSVDDQVTHTCDGSGFTGPMGIWDIGMPTVVAGDGRISSWTQTGRGTWTRQFSVPAVPNQSSGTVTFDLRHAPRP